jgi:hypothetical protein
MIASGIFAYKIRVINLTRPPTWLCFPKELKAHKRIFDQAISKINRSLSLEP